MFRGDEGQEVSDDQHAAFLNERPPVSYAYFDHRGSVTWLPTRVPREIPDELRCQYAQTLFTIDNELRRWPSSAAGERRMPATLLGGDWHQRRYIWRPRKSGRGASAVDVEFHTYRRSSPHSCRHHPAHADSPSLSPQLTSTQPAIVSNAELGQVPYDTHHQRQQQVEERLTRPPR